MIQIHLDPVIIDPVQTGRHFYFNIPADQGESFITAPCPGAETDHFLFLEQFIQMGGGTCHSLFKKDLRHSFALQNRGKGFQSETAGKHIFDLFHFIVFKRGIVEFADKNPAPDPLNGQICNIVIFRQKADIVHQFIFKHEPVVAFGGDLMIPA